MGSRFTVRVKQVEIRGVFQDIARHVQDISSVSSSRFAEYFVIFWTSKSLLSGGICAVETSLFELPSPRTISSSPGFPSGNFVSLDSFSVDESV